MKAIPKTAMVLGTGILSMWIAVRLFSTSSAAPTASTPWNPKAAAGYLDRRAEWWIAWPGAARDHGTFCVSCHTALSYSLARPALRTALDEQELSPNERKLLDNVKKRVRLRKEAEPFYSEQIGPGKSSQSRGTESVLNALILANFDSRNGKLSDDTQEAFQDMWRQQETTGDDKGAWPWLDFGNGPFEAKDSVFYGACLAAVAVGTAPENLLAMPDAQAYVNLLREYLDREYPRQSLINQVTLLWASAKLPGILTPQQRASIVEAVLSKQQADGGWNLSSLAWTWKGSTLKLLVKEWIRAEDTPLEGKSDGYATGFIAFSLEEYGLSRQDDHLQRALSWLGRNQNQTEGRWPGYSLNHPYERSPTGLFMSDAATAYAVLALTGATSGLSQRNR
jgi:squalene-hopene/tetraprenyl-beta-curcumene cyclase